MKKPEGKAEAGWYDAPEVEGYLQYWNGKYWTNKKQLKDGFENLEVLPEIQLGKFLFRSPIMNDGIFIAYLILSGLSAVYLIADYIKFSNGAETLTLLIPAIGITLIWIYILFLIVLVPRRFIDKKKGIYQPFSKANEFVDKTEGNLIPIQVRKSRNRYLIGILVTISVIAIVIFSDTKSTNKNEGDKYFEIEQRISKVIGEWNIAATPISEAVNLISNGEMNTVQARLIIGETSSKFAVIHNKLEDECSRIPKYNLNSTGFEFAISKAYDAIKVSCDLLPQESVEILALVNAQISETSTQADVDYHQNEIAVIIKKRKVAMLESLDAMEPYLNEAQKQTMQRLRNNFLG